MTDPYLLQGDIVLQELYFRGERYFFFRAFVHEVAHDLGQAADKQGRVRRFAEGLVIDIIQRIEKEVWLYLGFQQVELYQAFLLQHLFRLSLEGKISKGDTEDKAEDKDEQTAHRCIDHTPRRQRVIRFCKPGIVDALRQKGL